MRDKRDNQKSVDESDNETSVAVSLGRRDVMKMGVGASVVAMGQMLHVPEVLAQEGSRPYVPPPTAGGVNRGVPGGPPYMSPHTPTHRAVTYGWKNTSGRAYGNGPMDETSRRIVSYASSFSANVTDQVMKDIGTMLLDTLGCAISAQNTDSIRIGAKIAKGQRSDLKSTVWGYGITTTPEMAAFVNSCMVRHHDNNSEGMHETDMVPGIFAMGEALHSSGPQMISSMIMFWEIFAALLTAQPVGDAPGIRGVWSTIDNLVHAPALAVTCGKLMGLNEDQLANAISLAMVNHVALGVDHWDGPNSMSKSNHDPELCRAGIFAAICAREGMTGPAQPFEGPKGLWDVLTGPFDMKLPSGVGGNPMRPLPPGDKRYVVQTVEYKSVPGNGSSSGVCQTILANLDEYKKLVPTADDIASVDIEINQWGDSEDPGKWDPLNSETADHSPYMVARTLLDWELWESSFAIDKLTEPSVRKVMGKITVRENPGRHGTLFTVRNKTGGQIAKESAPNKVMTLDDVVKKFDRICAYKGVTDAQRDSIRSTWADLRNVKDIADPIRETLAHFGKPVAI